MPSGATTIESPTVSERVRPSEPNGDVLRPREREPRRRADVERELGRVAIEGTQRHQERVAREAGRVAAREAQREERPADRER